MFITVCSAVQKVVPAEWFIRKCPFGVKVFRENCELLCDNQNISVSNSYQLSPAPKLKANMKGHFFRSAHEKLCTCLQQPSRGPELSIAPQNPSRQSWGSTGLAPSSSHRQHPLISAGRVEGGVGWGRISCIWTPHSDTQN